MQNKIKTFENCELSFHPHRLIFLADGVERKITGQDVVNAMNKTKEGIDWERLKKMLGKLDKAGKWRKQAIETEQLKQLSDEEKTILAKAGEEVGKVIEKTHEAGKDLRKTVEAQTALKGEAQKCESAKETVANLVNKIAQRKAVDPDLITEVSVKKKGKKGEIVRLERKGDDFVAAGKADHFKISKGDVVVIGHDIFSADQMVDDKKVSVEDRQDKKSVREAISNPKAEAIDKIEIKEITLGVERANMKEVARAILARGIRQVSKNFFVGEHGALAGLVLEEQQKVLSLFEKNGQLKEAPLDAITNLVVAAAGRVETQDQAKMKSELLQDAGQFGVELAALVAIPSIIATLSSCGTVLAGYFPLAYIDIGRGIRQGKLHTFDKGDIKLLVDISDRGAEIAKLESQINQLGTDGEAVAQLSPELEKLKKQKEKLELIGVLRKLQKVENALKNDPNNADLLKDKKTLEGALSGKIVTPEHMQGLRDYSGEAVAKKQDREFAEIQEVVKKLEAGGILARVKNPEAARANVQVNLDALKRSLGQHQYETEQTRSFFNLDKFLGLFKGNPQMPFERWFGENVKTPEQAIQELNERMSSEIYGVNEIHSTLKYQVNLWENADFVLQNLFGIEKGKQPTFKNYSAAAKNEFSLVDLVALAKDPINAGITPEKLAELKKLEANPVTQKQLEDVLGSLQKYFSDSERSDSEHREGNFETRRLAQKILEDNSIGVAEKIYRLVALKGSENILAIEKQLVLKTNIENDKKIRDTLSELRDLLMLDGFIDEFKKTSPDAAMTLERVILTARWIEQKVDLKNLDQNASLHAKINDVLAAPIDEIKKYSAEIVKMAKDGISPAEVESIATKVKALDVKLTAAKKTVEDYLKVSETEARTSHKTEAVEGIHDPELKELNKKFKNAPVTERALPEGELAIFKKFAKELIGDGKILRSKEAFRAKMLAGFQFEGKTIRLKKYEFYKNSNRTETSNLPMITLDNIEDNVSASQKEQIARQLNLLILNVEQKGKNIVDTFYCNTAERAGMHSRATEVAEAIGKGKWLSQQELLAKYSGYIANTGNRSGAEDPNHFIAGKHPGGEFGGAFELKFERKVSVKINGKERNFIINYAMLSRDKCYNAVFLSQSSVKEIITSEQTFEKLTYVDAIAAVERQLFLLGVPFYVQTNPGACANCGNTVTNTFIDDAPQSGPGGVVLD
ncbi:MAG: hypothetical protein V2A63_02910 [Patescibacteria group bacterium]